MNGSGVDEKQLVRIWSRVVLRVTFLLAALGLTIWMLYLLSTVLLLLVLSVFFCYLLIPLVRLFEQPIYARGREIKIPRALAIPLAYGAVGATLFIALRMVLPILWVQITELAANLPEYISAGSQAMNKTFRDANSWLRHLRLPAAWREYLLEQISTGAGQIFPWLQAQMLGALAYLTYVPWLIIIPFLSFFMLKDAERFERSLVALVPNERLRKRVHWLLRDVNHTLAAYIRAQLTACAVIGTIVTAVLWAGGVPYAFVLGLVSGVLEFIPMVGPLTAAFITVSLTMTTSVKMALWVAAFLAALRIVQDYVIYPRIVGHGIKMHPLLVIIAIFAGAEIGGLSGVFLGIPFVALLIVSYNHYLAYRGLKMLKGDAALSTAAVDAEPQLSASGSPQLLDK